MKCIISGATGFIGSALTPILRAQGNEVMRLVRRKNSTSCCDVYWNPDKKILDSSVFTDADAIIHLSGENIASRWTRSKKEKIRDSRVNSTQFLSATISDLKEPPKVFIHASAIGYYGDRGNETLTEESPPGSGFLSDVCQAMEQATKPAAEKGIRTIHLRIGMVLGNKGGALAKMLRPFKLGLGGIIGSGNQYWSWISLDDLIGVISFLITEDSISGTVNVATPNPVTNKEFTEVLGHVLKRPTIFPVPAFAARLAFGEMANELLLASARVEPMKLMKSKYRFQYPTLINALNAIFAKQPQDNFLDQ